ncbi:Uncharacterised protein [Mycobacteroides abscessus subsp. abscessus]|nr:Uncharacterised protein [Mycobacteroides abscessus subsp. abscessus]
MARHHEKRHGDRRPEPQESPDRPQRRVDDDRRVSPEDRRPDSDGARSDGQQRHRDRAVELNHHGVGGVASCLLRMPCPMHTESRGDHHKQHRREQPDRRREAADRREISGNADRRRRHDPRTHHRREPVGRDVSKRFCATLRRRPAQRNVGGQRTVEDLGHDSQHRRAADVPEDGSALWGHKQCLWPCTHTRRDGRPLDEIQRPLDATGRPLDRTSPPSGRLVQPSGRCVQPTGQVSRRPSRRVPTSRRRRRWC